MLHKTKFSFPQIMMQMRVSFASSTHGHYYKNEVFGGNEPTNHMMGTPFRHVTKEKQLILCERHCGCMFFTNNAIDGVFLIRAVSAFDLGFHKCWVGLCMKNYVCRLFEDLRVLD